MKTGQHKTSHGSNADAHGRVVVYCETCNWRAKVDVTGMSWADGMEAIFKARDGHEAEMAKELKPPAGPRPA